MPDASSDQTLKLKAGVINYVSFAKAQGWVEESAVARDAFPITSVADFTIYLQNLKQLQIQKKITYKSIRSYISNLNVQHQHFELNWNDVYENPSIRKLRDTVNHRIRKPDRPVKKKGLFAEAWLMTHQASIQRAKVKELSSESDQDESIAALSDFQEEDESTLFNDVPSRSPSPLESQTTPPLIRSNPDKVYEYMENQRSESPPKRLSKSKQLSKQALHGSSSTGSSGGNHFSKFAKDQEWMKKFEDWQSLYPISSERFLEYLASCETDIGYKSFNNYILELKSLHVKLKRDWTEVIDSPAILQKIDHVRKFLMRKLKGLPLMVGLIHVKTQLYKSLLQTLVLQMKKQDLGNHVGERMIRHYHRKALQSPARKNHPTRDQLGIPPRPV